MMTKKQIAAALSIVLTACSSTGNDKQDTQEPAPNGAVANQPAGSAHAAVPREPLSAEALGHLRGFAQCLELDPGVTVIGDADALAKIKRNAEDPCKSAVAPTVDFAKDTLVIFRGLAGCTGAAAAVADGFVYSEWGDCEMALTITGAKIVPKGEADGQVVRKVAPLENPRARQFAMEIFARNLREKRLQVLQKFVPAGGLTIEHRSTGEDAKTTSIKRTRDTLKMADLDRTMLATKNIAVFNCTSEPKAGEARCLASGEGYMNGYTLRFDSGEFQVARIEENDH